MKKVMSVLLACLLLAVLAVGCGENATGSANNYIDVLQAARPAEMNTLDIYQIVADAATREGAGAGENDPLKMEAVFGPTGGFVEADMDKYAISLASTIIKVYGVAIILPAEGKQQAVMDQLNAYVEQQKAAQENYLPEQYAIASNAKIKVAPTGEILLAMCEDADTVMAELEAGLKA